MRIQSADVFAGKTIQTWVNWCGLLCLLASHLIFAPQTRCQTPPKKIAIIIQGKPHTTDVTDDNPKWADDSMSTNVQQMAAALKDKGFDVKATTRWSQDLPGLQDNAPPYQTTSSFVSLVNDLSGKIAPGDQVIVYYTGHASREFQEQPAINIMTTNWNAYVNSGQGGQKKKDMPRSNPADLTQNYLGYMDIGGTEGGATVTATQFATQMALLPGHKFVVIDACYAGMFKDPLIRIPGVESVYTSSRFDEPSYAGAADMIVSLNWQPPARNAPPQQTPEAALASLNLPGPAAIKDVKDNQGTTTGKQLVMTRPEGEIGSAFSYGFILGIKAAPNNSTTDQMLAAAFTSAWQRDPTAVAGLLDWKTTGTPFIAVNAKSHALSSTQKRWRKGHSHPSGVRRPPEGPISAVDVPPPPGLGGDVRGGGGAGGADKAAPGANDSGAGGGKGTGTGGTSGEKSAGNEPPKEPPPPPPVPPSKGTDDSNYEAPQPLPSGNAALSTEDNASLPVIVVHPNDLPPVATPVVIYTGNPKVDQEHRQQQQNLTEKQSQERQKLQQQQDQEHQQLTQQNASGATTQQTEQKHQQQTQQLQQTHKQQVKQLQEKQQPPLSRSQPTKKN